MTAGERICIEVDGPHHFSTNTLRPSGENLARQRLLRARGWGVVSIPFFKWSDKDDDDHAKLLQQVSANFFRTQQKWQELQILAALLSCKGLPASFKTCVPCGVS